MASQLLDFVDGRLGCWSRVKLESGENIHIAVSQTGVIVKRSNIGLFGAKLYEERNAYHAATTAQYLDISVDEYTTPTTMKNAVLRAFTQTALDSRTAAECAVRMNRALAHAKGLG